MQVQRECWIDFLASLLGIALGQFCFGSQIWHLILQSCISYLMLCIIPPKHSYKVVFAFCMLYMSASKSISHS